MGLTISGAISAGYWGAQSWFVECLGIASATSIAVYIAGFIYFALTDPDLLRTERYLIQKTAIEHGLVGDSTTGFVRLEGPKMVKQLPESKSESEV